MKGFTLIEVMVSVAIFATVMVMSLGALLAMSESNRRVETMKSVINTLNFALDSMSRTIRTGYNYQCNPTSPSSADTTPTNCATAQTKFAFMDSDSNSVFYCLGTVPTSGSPSCSTTGTAILHAEEGGTLMPITSKEVVIQALKFYVVGAPTGDDIQPKVTMLVSGYVDVTATQRSTFNLQTSVTQRIYDQ